MAIERGIVGTSDSSNLAALKARLKIGDPPNSGDILNTMNVYGNRFSIPLDFELFTTIMPFH